MPAKRRGPAYCGRVVHSLRLYAGSRDFERRDLHPCYMNAGHAGGCRCWTED